MKIFFYAVAVIGSHGVAALAGFIFGRGLLRKALAKADAVEENLRKYL